MTLLYREPLLRWISTPHRNTLVIVAILKFIIMNKIILYTRDVSYNIYALYHAFPSFTHCQLIVLYPYYNYDYSYNYKYNGRHDYIGTFSTPTEPILSFFGIWFDLVRM